MKNIHPKLTPVLLLGLLCLSANIPAEDADHDIHLSKCQVNCSEGSLDLRCHIWLDDLTAALALNGISDPQLLTPKEAAGADEILNNYLQAKLKISLNGTPIQPQWIGKEASEDGLAIWAQLHADNIGQLQKVSVTNELLMELYDDQQNIVHLKGPDGKQGYLIFEKVGQVEEVKF